MDEQFRSYLTFLGNLRQGLETLTDLADQKRAAVEQDDLVALDEVLRQEQAQALFFRGLEQTREKLLDGLGLRSVPLSRVPDRCPPALREEIRQAVSALQERYRVYEEHSRTARELLEKNLREVESTIAAMGVRPASQGPGYRGPGVQLPPSMRTDFRA